EWFFKMLKQVMVQTGDKLDPVKVDAEMPTAWGRTADNLKAAISGEHMENSTLYPEFARVAETEGYPDVAKRIKAITMAEKHHEERYAKLLKEVEAGTIFKKKEPVYWMCRKCGYMHYGTEAPEKCPSCDHERSYYQKICEQY
ncbi:MAG TPA: rubrerythrin family protein, partial [Methanocella sp.]|nr:rubrerythrin family protein [Methanocella sp.]